jgi:hypothetical protein
MVFGRNLKMRDETRPFADLFDDYPAWIGRLGKKIESWKFLDFFQKSKIFLDPIS